MIGIKNAHSKKYNFKNILFSSSYWIVGYPELELAACIEGQLLIRVFYSSMNLLVLNCIEKT